MLKLISRTSLLALASIVALGSVVRADYVTNGSFESYTGGHNGAPSAVWNGTGDPTDYTNLTGWSLDPTGYTFLFAPGTADTTGSYTPEFHGALSVWGPGTGVANGLTATSPDGGNFIISDPVFQTAPFHQSLSGLTAGKQYVVSFWYAGGQEAIQIGDTTEGWQVSLGGQTLSTPILSNVYQGFTGWQHETMFFTADSASPVLTFLALGTPSGLPPMAFLDGVSVTDVPLPSPMLLGLMGLIALVGARRLSKARRTAKLAL